MVWLNDKVRVVSSRVQKLVDAYLESEDRLIVELRSLTNGDADCDCDIPEHVGVIEGDYLIGYCKKCGGTVVC